MDYCTYSFTKGEYFKYISLGLIVIGVFSILFFNNLVIGVVLTPIIYAWLRIVRSYLIKERKAKLREEFCDCLESVSVAMTAGYSVENAYAEAISEMSELHGDDALIVKELQIVNNKVLAGVRIEAALKELALRSGIEEILDYSEVFSISKRTDGNIIKMSRNTSRIIQENIEVNKECITLIAGKKNELLIMRIMPPAMIAYLRMSSPGFFDGMYGNISGIVIMSIILIVYLATNWFSGFITNKVIDKM